MSLAVARHAGALVVLLATLGCAPQRPAAPTAALEALRQSLPGGLSALVAGVPDGPRVILVHGTPGSASGWSELLLDPPPGLELVALDRPGFGRSGPEAAVTRLADQAEAVARLLPSDGRGAVLVGHSLGGAIVARVAAEHPGEVLALVLVAASLDPALEKVHPLQPLGAWPPLRALLPRAIRNANAELLALQPELVELGALLPRITAPVRILHGTADALVPVANVDYLRRRLTGARCIDTLLLPGANHFLPWNASERVRAAIEAAVRSAC
ncbi:MAG: alpha/beta fold hydrolase [Piscinibacter sp.]|uniref:alpha/beta fold hydrolase n=1 Tax=Piscinibacter sp. TaxID=1903157 RepID=UPI002590C1FF|nr:alpha/beta fold hydrolase [Piscinibacter sp.]MCW5664376.1 alpha/beta fold hydrolase [Piscinibacter sp.]